MESLKNTLENHPFISGFSREHIDLMVGCAKNVVIKENEYLFKEGENANSFYIIRSGKITLEIFSHTKGAIQIQTLHEGDIIGWSWMIPPYKWKFDAKAMEDCRIIELDGKCLRTKCEKDFGLGYELMKRLAHVFEERIHALRLQLIDMYSKNN